jgi:hypothetical protein
MRYLGQGAKMFNSKMIEINRILKKAFRANRSYEEKIEILREIPDFSHQIIIEEPGLSEPAEKNSEKPKNKLSKKELKTIQTFVSKQLRESETINELLLENIVKVIKNEVDKKKALKLIQKIDFSKVNLTKKNWGAFSGILIELNNALKRAGLTFKNLPRDQFEILSKGQIDGHDMANALKKHGLNAILNLID